MTYNPVDKNKLKRCLAECGKTMVDLSLDLGCNKSYISDCIKRNNGITNATKILLERIYDIQYEDIKPDENPEQTKIDIGDTIIEHIKELVSEFESSIIELVKGAIK